MTSRPLHFGGPSTAKVEMITVPPGCKVLQSVATYLRRSSAAVRKCKTARSCHKPIRYGGMNEVTSASNHSTELARRPRRERLWLKATPDKSNTARRE